MYEVIPLKLHWIITNKYFNKNPHIFSPIAIIEKIGTQYPTQILVMITTSYDSFNIMHHICIILFNLSKITT